MDNVNINIEDYKDYKNVTIAEYVSAQANVEKAFWTTVKEGKVKEALRYAGLYMELSKFYNKRIAYGSKYGYDGSGRKK